MTAVINNVHYAGKVAIGVSTTSTQTFRVLVASFLSAIIDQSIKISFLYMGCSDVIDVIIIRRRHVGGTLNVYKEIRK